MTVLQTSFLSFVTLLGSVSAVALNSTLNSTYTPVAERCGPGTANITCIHRYGSILPPSFSRDPSPAVGYSGTLVPDDDSWANLVPTADFIVFNQDLGLALLGPAPKIYHNYIPLLNVIHEAPMYVPELNKLFIAQYGPPGNLTNIAIDLNTNPPAVEAFTTNPPIYQPAGGTFHDGYIYWAVQGNNLTLPNNLEQRPGIARVDPKTFKAEWLLNNYHGFFFGGLNDLTVDSVGDIWFTDSDYSWGLGLNPSAPQIQLATYRFRPSTGEVQIVDSTLQHPNGIAFSRDGKTLYITDSGLETVGKPGTENKGPGDFYNYPIRIEFTGTNARNIYAFDVERPDGAAGNPVITGKRNIFQSVEGNPDGIKVARNGYLVVATGLSNGVDVLTAEGSLIARIQTKHPVENVAFAGDDYKTIYLVGIGGVTKVEWDLQGPVPGEYFQV
ncbi:calcium-dependent phosphotriesterase [Periconia macrospinosa]|uniref:Calcium-dependent phosphotriesterase n=1 Tax=Periconia macrospinosa TaxID=97972 RepID=A0A2V1DCZ1_9PLEO|nr:calcium-dependent phosphotriesterase [Periconia macrospinosa]